MTIKSLFLKILIIAVIVIVLIILLFYFTLRTKTNNLANQTPYKELINTEQSIKRFCYIAKREGDNNFILQLENEFYSDVGPAYKIPIDTKIYIDGAKSFYGSVSGNTTYKVFGKVFVKELNKEVIFKYIWEGEKPLEIDNYDNYIRYPLTVWQDDPIPLKFTVEDNTASEYTWPMYSKNREFNKILERIYTSNSYRGNRDYKNTTFERENYIQGMNLYEGYDQFVKEEYALLQLENIYADITTNASNYIVGNDHRYNISANFISIILTLQIEKDTMESVFINYDVNGKYIDHIVLSKAHRSKGSLVESKFEGLDILMENKIANDSIKNTKVKYSIQQNGIIQLQ